MSRYVSLQPALTASTFVLDDLFDKDDIFGFVTVLERQTETDLKDGRSTVLTGHLFIFQKELDKVIYTSTEDELKVVPREGFPCCSLARTRVLYCQLDSNTGGCTAFALDNALRF